MRTGPATVRAGTPVGVLTGALTGALTAVLTLLLTGCAGGGDGSGDTRLAVLAASSLTEPFGELERRFEASHPGVDVVLSVGSSTTMAQQVVDGAPGDVLATADVRSMSLAVEGGAARDPREFATNRLTLVVPADNPADVAGLSDLDREEVAYLTCVATAPCGAVAREVLADGGVSHPPVSEEVDVKSVLARVAAGEADAGLVYRSDAVAAGDAVRALPTPGSQAHPTDYLIAPVGSGSAGLGERFVAFVLSPEGRRVLVDAGFGVGEAR